MLLLFALGLLGACPAPEHVEDPPDLRERCTANLAFCDGDVAKQCGENGYVSDSELCDPAAVCIAGVCEANIVCRPNETICVQNALWTCNEGGTAFDSQQECGSQICSSGACITPTDTCPPGLAYCTGNTAYQCNEDGTGLVSAPVNCDDNICVNGFCEDVICVAGEASCQGEQAQTCNALGTGYATMEACAPPNHCIDGRCQELLCSPGRSCADNTAIECNEQGTQIINTRDCGTRVCVEGFCTDVFPDAGSTDQANRDSAVADSTIADHASTDTWLPDSALPDSADPDTASFDAGAAPCDDGDGDHYGQGSGCLGRDCDDSRADVHPGATEFGDGVDNDCDGSIDEGLSCSSNSPAKPCITVGACSANSGISQTCTGGVWTTCPVAAHEETCDNIDNDCNGVVDDTLAYGEACTSGIGACEQPGYIVCAGDVQQEICEVNSSTRNGAEACSNNIDDDCDGQTDESNCCLLGSTIDPSTQACRRDLRPGLCKTCTSHDQCGDNFNWCINLGYKDMLCTGTGQGTCPSPDYTCEDLGCDSNQDCPGGGTCEGGFPGLFSGTCTTKVCSFTSCGVDCRDNMPCPAGYTCYGIFLTNLDCRTNACPSNDCYNSGDETNPNYICRQSGESCVGDAPCAPLTCIEGRCQIGQNCLPSSDQSCTELSSDPACTVDCGDGAHCQDQHCVANTTCSESIHCPMGNKCIQGACQQAEACQSNSDCDTPSFFCNSGYCDNADPCANDSECPDQTYCDLESNPAVCTSGCRLSSPSGCASDHYCNADHQCIINSVSSGDRCAACDDQNNPCIEAGTFCNPLTARCDLLCFGDNTVCQQQIVPTSECLFLGCTNPDCP